LVWKDGTDLDVSKVDVEVLKGSKRRTHKHDSVSKLRSVIKTVNLSSVLGNGSKGKDVVEVETESRVDVVDEVVDVLLGALEKEKK
jgi:hypothetical protein